MQPIYKDGNVRAHCSECDGAVTTFESRDSSKEFGSIGVSRDHQYGAQNFNRIMYVLMRCASCHRGGLAKIHDRGNVHQGTLESFFPISIDSARIPKDVPAGIAAEFREAELCSAFRAWRGSSALLRSTLEKTLKANGYTKGSLEAKIDEAAKDGVITEARRKRAHDDIRVLGNDVLHDEWREVKPEEVDAAHQYTQRILEDLYDDRKSVEAILLAKGRLQAQAQPQP